MIYSRDIENIYSPDVLVCGGGPAGICAAVSAARAGAQTLLIEQNAFCGGMATAGLVAPFMTCYDSGGDEMLIRGLFEEIVNRLIEKGGAIHPSEVTAPSSFTSYITVGHMHVTPFRAETLKNVADEMLTEAGVKVIYHASFVDAEAENGHISSVIVHFKEGLRRITPKIVVDCTGDADVAAAAGVPYDLGNPKTGKIQPASLFFRIGNVDLSEIEKDYQKNINNFYRKDGVNYRSLHWWVEKARQAGDWNLDRVSIGLFRDVDEDEWSINTSRIMNIDGTRSESLTEAEIEGRKQVDQIFKFFRKYVPGCKDAKLLQTGSTIGIRETRHIKGIRTLTIDDVLNCTVPDDSVMVGANSVDIHGKFGPKSNEYIALPAGKYYGVPYGTMIPVNTDNLIVSGRCISAESDAAGAIRVMPPCMALGQAAGSAAALCAAKSISPALLDTSELRTLLSENGVKL